MVVKIIPKSDIKEDFSIEEQPTKTYKLNTEKNIVEGLCDELEAIKQAIYCILNTERFQYLMYSWNYGIELNHLIGKQNTYVIPELERVIKEALIQDDRIEDVVDFNFTQTNKNTILVRFKAITTIGDTEIEKEVDI